MSHTTTSTRRLAFAATIAFLAVATVAPLSAAITSPITTNLAYWVDANDLDGDGVAEGLSESGQTAGAVSTWVDKSPSARNATQANAALQPLLATNELQGKPVVRFDGADDILQTAAFASAIAQPAQTFLVWMAEAKPAGIGDAVIDGLSSGNRHGIIYENRPTDVPGNPTAAGIILFAGAGGFPGDYYIYDFTGPIVETALWNDAAGTNDNYIDGALVKQTNTGTAAMDGVTLGARFAPFGGDPFTLDGYIAEVLIYSSPLSESDRLLTEEYLTNKWIVPEPSALALTAGALGVLATRGRRRRHVR